MNNRILKFRAWDNVKKEMMGEVWEIRFSNKHSDVENVVAGDRQSENFTLMQFTGLKDKNGKECYEGDLVKHPQYPTPLRVEWDYDQWGLFDGMCNEASFDKDCEIVGNIYEHEHLLK